MFPWPPNATVSYLAAVLGKKPSPALGSLSLPLLLLASVLLHCQLEDRVYLGEKWHFFSGLIFSPKEVTWMHEEATKSIENTETTWVGTGADNCPQNHIKRGWFYDGLQVTQCHTVTKKDVPVPYFMPLLAVTAMYGQWDLGIDWLHSPTREVSDHFLSIRI